MKIFYQKRGFTLVELLVVVAVIGLLASIAIAAISNARNKAKNTTIKENMYSLKLAAELEYDQNNSYDAVCTEGSPGDLSGSGNFLRIRDAINVNGVESSGRVCYDDTTVWCFEVNSMPYNSENWCVDYTGYAGTVVDCDGGVGGKYTCAAD